MVHILDLPTEVLNHILSFIGDIEDGCLEKPADGEARFEGRTAAELERNDKHREDDDADDDEYKDLRNICLVSRMFRQLAQPLLFCDFDEDGLSGDLGRISSFTAAIYRNPKLGEHVQSVSILSIAPPSKPRQIDGEYFVLFKRAIKDLHLAGQEKAWISAMKKADLSVLIALLLNKTPNIRQLDLPGEQFSTTPFASLFDRNPSFLSRLEYLSIDCDGEMMDYSIASYEKFLTLPNLLLPTFEYGDLDDASFPSAWTPGTLTIEKVDFEMCHIDAGAIQKFMQACKKLKYFSYDSFSIEDPFTRRTPKNRAAIEFTAAEAQKAALLHKDTLEWFYLGFARNPQPPWSQVKLGSFRDFSVLETIAVSQAILPAHPQFPPALKTLHITDCLVSIRDVAQAIANDCKHGLYSNFTEFKVITVDVTLPIKLPGQISPPGQTPEQCFLSLRDMFKGTAVDFQIASYRMPEFDDDDDDDGYVNDGPYFALQMIGLPLGLRDHAQSPVAWRHSQHEGIKSGGYRCYPSLYRRSKSQSREIKNMAEFISLTFPNASTELNPIPNAGIDPAYLVRYARTLDDYGFNYTLVPYDSSYFDPFTVGATIAAVTKNIKVIIALRPNTLYPTVAAKALATLDQLSSGRVVVHFIAGGSDAEQAKEGDFLSKDERYARLEEYIRILRRAWESAEPFDWEGKYFQFKQFSNKVRPTNGTSIPVSVGGSSDEAYRIGGSLADIFGLWGEPLKETKQQIDRIYAEAEKAGRTDRPRIWVTFRPIVAETEELAWAKAHRTLDVLNANRANGQGRVPANAPPPQNVGSQRLLEIAARGEVQDRALWYPTVTATNARGASTALVGSPQTIADSILDYIDLGADLISIRGYDNLNDAIDYGRYVLPRVRERLG
ncbi:hypothetical protein UA08_02944 [Talaromyces atroroseus]|uniref:Luciferase-like domain-containing protein n=1 Tax=Talaromyces atroroseus TaxID=1441469 RepID=A0A225ASR8_TALAT|nr:hypothetical protein UA08_02944 [Talaromyces atroroseus]OKL62553.1 hypothetical protein UA08_02944 [Talaromyces atroroseus]